VSADEHPSVRALPAPPPEPPQLDKLAALRKPFPEDQLGTLPGRGGSRPLTYVGHADLTARLLDVDPLWSWEPFALDERGLPAFDKDGNLWIRLTVCGHTRIGVGDAGNGKGAKEAIGDALRNAGMRFGAALELWAKGERDYEREQVVTEAVRPEWYTKTLDAIFQLPADKKDSLRAWMQQEQIDPTPAKWTEDNATAIRHRIHQITAS
jgi:hypothetical protein